jgi:hypothetical protein
MVAPSLINSRRFPQPLRARVQVAYARAWEALAETHRAEAVRFVRMLGSRLPAEEALQRYFREVAVPPQMQESVRARALMALVDELAAASGADAAPEMPKHFSPADLIGALKRRAQYVEETNLCCQLAASLADEQVCSTHVRNACEIAHLLVSALPLDEAIMHYIRAFELPMVEAQMVFQRTLAQMAERHPLLTATAPVEPLADMPSEATGPRLSRPASSPAPSPAYSLRAIG